MLHPALKLCANILSHYCKQVVYTGMDLAPGLWRCFAFCMQCVQVHEVQDGPSYMCPFSFPSITPVAKSYHMLAGEILCFCLFCFIFFYIFFLITLTHTQEEVVPVECLLRLTRTLVFNPPPLQGLGAGRRAVVYARLRLYYPEWR